MLVKAAATVDQNIKTLSAHMVKGDCIIGGGNEWYENTERREKAMADWFYSTLGWEFQVVRRVREMVPLLCLVVRLRLTNT